MQNIFLTKFNLIFLNLIFLWVNSLLTLFNDDLIDSQLTE